VNEREGVDKYHKRDPEILSKHLLKDVSNGKFGNEKRIMNGRKEQWNKRAKPKMNKTVVVDIQETGMSVKFHHNRMPTVRIQRVYVFCVTVTTSGYYFPKYLNRFVILTEINYVYCAVRIQILNKLSDAGWTPEVVLTLFEGHRTLAHTENRNMIPQISRPQPRKLYRLLLTKV
jgi:hypothetical protein